MKAFITSGMINEKLALVEVEPCEWPSGYADWVYKTYPSCYQIKEKIDEIDIKYLPNRYQFLDWKNHIGSLPGVHPVYEATKEKIEVFLEAKRRIKEEEDEEERRFREWNEKYKQEKEEMKKQFTISKVFELEYPKGGENGQDGYYDVELKSVTGAVVRVVARNVFDFGFYTYPKRVEGTKSVFEDDKWTELEKLACKYVRMFSPFTTQIRM